MQSLVSTQMVEYRSFCFQADWMFQEKTSSLCECWILKSVNFSICILPVHKIVPNLSFSAPSVCTFYSGWNVTESFSESLHFVILGLCS